MKYIVLIVVGWTAYTAWFVWMTHQPIENNPIIPTQWHTPLDMTEFNNERQ